MTKLLIRVRDSFMSLVKFAGRNILLIFLLCGVIGHSTYGEPPSQKEVKSLLEGYEWRIDVAKFNALGDDVDLTLIEIVEEPSPMLNFYRLRALEVLRFYPKPRVAEFLENYVQTQNNSARVARAFNSFAKNFSEVAPERVQRMATHLLKHENPRLRISAVKALRKIKTDNARKMIQAQLEKETKPWVLKRMRK